MSTKNGFSLIELLVTVGIIGALATVTSQILFSTIRSNTKSEIIKEVKQNGEYAMETMRRFVQNAQTVTSACTPSGQTKNFLTIMLPSGQSTTFRCRADSSVGRIASESGAQTKYLTSESVTLGGVDCTASTLQFTCTQGAGSPQVIDISYTLTQAGTVQGQYEKAQESFSSSIIVRTQQY